MSLSYEDALKRLIAVVDASGSGQIAWSVEQKRDRAATKRTVEPQKKTPTTARAKLVVFAAGSDCGAVVAVNGVGLARLPDQQVAQVAKEYFRDIDWWGPHPPEEELEVIG